MEWDIKHDVSAVDWQWVSDTLRRAGMAYHRPDIQQKAFENSYAVAFAYGGGRPVGFGRAVSDGAYQSAVYDVAVLPEYQRQGVGTAIIRDILERLPSGNVILYAAPGKEAFYRTLGFRIMKTAMARFRRAEVMAEKGFTD